MFSIIAAISENLVLGDNNNLIWHIPEDLNHFKELTLGKTIIMGRKTFESLPNVLPNRKHIILTKNKNFILNHKDVKIIHNIDEVILKYKDSLDEIFIIGGGEIYKEFLPYCNKLYLTKIQKKVNGDTYFPKINKDSWTLIKSKKFLYNNHLEYFFNEYKKRES